MRFMQTESVLQTKNRSGPAKNRFSVALVSTIEIMLRLSVNLLTLYWAGLDLLSSYLILSERTLTFSQQMGHSGYRNYYMVSHHESYVVGLGTMTRVLHCGLPYGTWLANGEPTFCESL